MQHPTVVIVNFNAGDALLRCLGGLAEQTVAHHVIVVDNASSDHSARIAHDRYPSVRFLPLRRNVGFARAVNLAAGRIPDEDSALVLLNPDTVPRPDFIERLVEPLASDPGVGAAAGTLVFSSVKNTIASAGIVIHRNGVAIDARLGEPLDTTRPVQPVFGASGGAAAYRLATFRRLGGFCEPFFLYLEDVDLAWRLQLAGLSAVSVPSAVATHDYSSAAGEGSPFKRRMLARNRIWTLARCLPDPLWKRDRLWILSFDIAAAGFAATRLDIPAFRGRVEGVAALPTRLRERTSIQAAASVHWEHVADWIQPPVSPRELLRLRRLTFALANRV